MSKEWLQHYLSLEDDFKDPELSSQIDFDEGLVLKSSSKPISRKKKIVRKSKPTKPTTDQYIQVALSNEEKGLHIDQIIDRIELAGWKSASKYNKYSTVYSALSKNYFVFRNMGASIFKLRKGFKKDNLKSITKPTKIHKKPNNLITLADIIADTIKLYKSSEYGMYPGEITAILNKVGYLESYSSVYKTLQESSQFKKNGNFYVPTKS